MDFHRRTLRQSRYQYDSDAQSSVDNVNRISTIDEGRGTLETRSASSLTASSLVSTFNTPSNHLDQPDHDDNQSNVQLDDSQEIRIEHMRLFANRVYDNAFVSHIDHPSAFFIQLFLPDGKFEDLHLKINDFYSKQSKNRPKWQRGQYCVAKYYPDDKYYRARIVKPLNNNFYSKELPTNYTVIFIDFGNREDVAVNDIHCLEEEFTHLPAQAIPCSLAETLPRSHTWDHHPSGTNLFRKLIDQQHVNIKVQPKSLRDAWPLNFVEISHPASETNIRDRLREANEIRIVSNEEIYYTFNPMLTRDDLIIYNIDHEETGH